MCVVSYLVKEAKSIIKNSSVKTTLCPQCYKSLSFFCDKIWSKQKDSSVQITNLTIITIISNIMKLVQQFKNLSL